MMEVSYVNTVWLPMATTALSVRKTNLSAKGKIFLLWLVTTHSKYTLKSFLQYIRILSICKYVEYASTALRTESDSYLFQCLKMLRIFYASDDSYPHRTQGRRQQMWKKKDC